MLKTTRVHIRVDKNENKSFDLFKWLSVSGGHYLYVHKH
jgi:hypothetical protein